MFLSFIDLQAKQNFFTTEDTESTEESQNQKAGKD